jgi:hypothetical protein
MHDETEYKGWRKDDDKYWREDSAPVLYIIYVVTSWWYIYRSKRKNIKNKKKNLGKNTKCGFYTRTCKKLPPKLARPCGFSSYLKLRHLIKEEDFEGYSFITLLFIFKLKLLDIFGSCCLNPLSESDLR